MEQYNYNTELFKNVFPSYEVFSEWYKSIPLSESVEDCPSEKTFTLIAYEYNDSHLAYSVDGFKQHFALQLYSYYKEFEETTKGIISLMNLTDKDIAIADSMITNIANIPETVNSTDAEQVDFISTQQKSINKKGKLQVQKELLSNKRAFTTKTFLNRFRNLFIKILSPSYTYVVCEEE